MYTIFSSVEENTKKENTAIREVVVTYLEYGVHDMVQHEGGFSCHSNPSGWS